MPEFDVSERHHTLVQASRDRAYEVVRNVDLARDPMIRALFAMRGLGRSRTFNVDDFLRVGFVLLGEEPGEELVLGVVGQFWTRRGGVLRIDPESFASFGEPGYAKATWNVRVEPAGEAGTVVLTETRVRCTDDAGRSKFLRYWLVVGPFSALIRKRSLALVKALAERR